MKTWKKNAVAAAVLVAVCAGIYVNWLYTEQNTVASITDTLDETKILSADTLVMSTSPLEVDNNESLSDYFAAVRLSRQEARDSAVGLLQEAIAYSSGSAENNAQLESIIQTALCEAQIESLVLAKGYDDCVAYISDSGISVAVAAPENGLAQKDVAVIADIVMTQSNFDIEMIRVVEVP